MSHQGKTETDLKLNKISLVENGLFISVHTKRGGGGGGGGGGEIYIHFLNYISPFLLLFY